MLVSGIALILAFTGNTISNGAVIGLMVAVVSALLFVVLAIIPLKPRPLGTATIIGQALSIKIPGAELMTDVSKLKIILSTNRKKACKDSPLIIDDFNDLSQWNNRLIVDDDTGKRYQFNFEPEVTLLQLTRVDISFCTNRSILLTNSKDVVKLVVESLAVFEK